MRSCIMHQLACLVFCVVVAGPPPVYGPELPPVLGPDLPPQMRARANGAEGGGP